MAAIVLGLAVATTGCWDQNPTKPSSGAINVPVLSESFNGTLPLGGAKFYSFSTSYDGSIGANLITLKEDGNDSSALVSVTIGAPVGITCSTQYGQTITAGTSAVVSADLAAGVYCVQISDPGNLVSPGVFSITITHPK